VRPAAAVLPPANTYVVGCSFKSVVILFESGMPVSCAACPFHVRRVRFMSVSCPFHVRFMSVPCGPPPHPCHAVCSLRGLDAWSVVGVQRRLLHSAPHRFSVFLLVWSFHGLSSSPAGAGIVLAIIAWVLFVVW
jgi:hypothetical protein